MKVTYQPEQVFRAAKFLKKRNPYFSKRSLENIELSIMALLRRHVRDVKECLQKDTDWRYTGTGGYWIFAFLADEKTIQVEVLVDAAVCKNVNYTYLEE